MRNPLAVAIWLLLALAIESSAAIGWVTAVPELAGSPFDPFATVPGP